MIFRISESNERIFLMELRLVCTANCPLSGPFQPTADALPTGDSDRPVDERPATAEYQPPLPRGSEGRRSIRIQWSETRHRVSAAHIRIPPRIGAPEARGRFFGLTLRAYFLNVRREVRFLMMRGLRITWILLRLVSVRTVTSSSRLFSGPQDAVQTDVCHALARRRSGWEVPFRCFGRWGPPRRP